MTRLSVVIPVYNEEKAIAETLRRLETFLDLKGWEWEILVSSDGSTDKTESVARSFAEARSAKERSGLVQPGKKITVLPAARNEGKGAASRRGILAAKGEYVLLTDADLSTPIKEVEPLIRTLESGADVAIGSRALREPGCDVQQSFRRRLSGRVFNFFVRMIVLPDFKDTQCGFKCFKREAARALFQAQKMDGFVFDVEILYLAKLKGLKVSEVPVMWRQGRDSRVSLIKDSISMLKGLFVIKRIHSRV